MYVMILLVQVLQTLALLHVCMKRKSIELEEVQNRTKSLEGVDGVDKDDCTPGEPKEEVVEKYILWVWHVELCVGTFYLILK